MMQKHRDKIYAFLIFLFAFILRLIYFSQMKGSPFFLDLGIDPEFYMGLALKINKGDLFPEGIFWYHPFFPYFLALLNNIFHHSLYMIRLSQHIIGSLGCVLVYYLSKDLLGRRVALIASFIMAADGFIIFSEFTLESDYLAVFLCLLASLLIVYSRKRFSFSLLFLAGVVCALFVLTRANILPILTFIWIIWDYKEIGLRIGIRRALIFLLGFILVIGAVTSISYFKSGDFMIVGSHGGVNFYAGNGPYSDGAYANIPFIAANPRGEHEDFLKHAEFLTGKKLKYVEASNFWFTQALKYIVSNPAAYLKLLARKFYLFFRAYEIPDNTMNYYFTKEYYSSLLRFLPLGFSLIFPLGVIGMILGYSLRRKLSLLYLYVIGYIFFLVQFSIRARYRLPVIPLLIIFAAYALYQLWIILRTKDIARFVMFSFFFFSVYFLSSYKVDTRQHFDTQYYNLGVAHYGKGEFEEAEKNYFQALRINPQCLSAWENLGGLYLETGRYKKAEDCFSIVKKIYPSSAKAWCGRAVLWQMGNDTKSAIEGYQEALKINPIYAQALWNLAEIYYENNEFEKSSMYFKKAVKVDPDSEKLLKFQKLK